ncbi:MAG: hypothetical protein K6F48_07595 [Paludibacteraceae bacterium]|nr:hypothetical protein [Paludibacteraceae bacterium]
MRKSLLMMLVLLSCLTGGISAKDASGDIHALLFVEGGYSHSFGDLNSTWSQYFSSFQRQLRNGYSVQAAALGCITQNACVGFVVWKKGFSASDDDLVYSTTEDVDMKYIGPALGCHEYFGPGLLGLYASAGYTRYSDKYVTQTSRTGEWVEDRFVTGAFGYLIDMKYLFCIGKYVVAGPSIGYYGFRVKTNNDPFWRVDWDADCFRVDGFNITGCLGVKF